MAYWGNKGVGNGCFIEVDKCTISPGYRIEFIVENFNILFVAQIGYMSLCPLWY